MKKEQKIRLSPAEHYIKTDMPKALFKQIQDLLENNLPESLFKDKKTHQIKEVIETFLSDELKQNFIIVIAFDPAFNLQYKKGAFLMMKIFTLTFFIYQPRPVDISKMIKLDQFDRKQWDYEQASQLVVITNKNSNELFIEKIRVYIGLYLMKHLEEREQNISEFEQQLVMKIKQEIALVSLRSYWHCFLARKIDTIVKQREDEIFLEFGFTIQNKQDQDVKYTLIAFQKQGGSLTPLESIKFKYKEIVSFLLIGIIFITLVTCKEHKQQDGFCVYRSEILTVCGVIFFGVIMTRMMKKFISSKVNKAKQEKKAKLG